MKNLFPLFANHPDLVYLDNAATVQKPQYVLDEVNYFLTHAYANIHRGSYPLAIAAEQQRDYAREVVAQSLGAEDDTIVFTSNATHSSNLLAQSMLFSGWIKQGDIIAIGIADHHANITPRQLVAERTGAEVKYVGYDPVTREYDRSVFSTFDLTRLKVVSLSLVSNVTGKRVNLDFVKKLSKNCQMYLALDASQFVPHYHLDVALLEADFVYFTGHKIGALTGIGVLWGKKEHLARLQPAFVGGGAIDRVTCVSHTYQPAPDKFEPGTPNVMGAVSLRASFEWIASLSKKPSGAFPEHLADGYRMIAEQEAVFVDHCCKNFAELQDQGLLHIIGPMDSKDRIGLFSRSLPSGKAHQLGWELGEKNICIRTGEHCTHPFHDALGEGATARMSLWAYNDRGDLQRFFSALRRFLSQP